MHKGWLLTASVLLSGCASAPDRGTETVRAEWGACIARQVARLDDGRADPVSIAYGAAPGCKTLYADLTEIMVRRNFTEGGQMAMRQQMRDGELELVTAAVLARRRSSAR